MIRSLRNSKASLEAQMRPAIWIVALLAPMALRGDVNSDLTKACADGNLALASSFWIKVPILTRRFFLELLVTAMLLQAKDARERIKSRNEVRGDYGDYIAILKQLILHKADVNAEDLLKHTPLARLSWTTS